ncbi:MAG: hypothetical protein ACTHMM_16485 [Agriterribacter sp.]
MTKKSIFALLVSCAFLLTACLDAEEKIVINKNNSGIYTLTMDMGKMLTLLEQMGQKDQLKEMEKKDSTVYFKSYVDTSTALTAKEKELIRDGSLRMQVDEAAKEMKVVLSFPFKNVAVLPDLKNTYITAIDKLGISKKLNKGDAAEDNPTDMPDDVSGNKSVLMPGQEAYAFTAAPGKIANKLVNKELFSDKVLKDSSLQMMQQLSVMMGDMNYKTVFVLPNGVKKYKGNNVEVAPDKKTVTFFTTLTDLINRPEAAEYSVEY